MKGDLVVSKSIASRTDHVQNPMLTWGILCALWIASDNGGSAISENSPMSCVVIAVAILVHTIKTMRFLKKNNDCTCCSQSGFPFHRHLGGWCVVLLESFSEWRTRVARICEGDYVIPDCKWDCACTKPKAG